MQFVQLHGLLWQSSFTVQGQFSLNYIFHPFSAEETEKKLIIPAPKIPWIMWEDCLYRMLGANTLTLLLLCAPATFLPNGKRTLTHELPSLFNNGPRAKRQQRTTTPLWRDASTNTLPLLSRTQQKWFRPLVAFWEFGVSWNVTRDSRVVWIMVLHERSVGYACNIG